MLSPIAISKIRKVTHASEQANSDGWTGSPDDPNAGGGQYGSCCNEMDIWEGNSVSTAYTP
jgi:cellulose 1,4-beta-cellobiosidase